MKKIALKLKSSVKEFKTRENKATTKKNKPQNKSHKCTITHTCTHGTKKRRRSKPRKNMALNM